MINVEFPKRYYRGSFCWDNELPYLVQRAMYLLDEIINESMSILEFGSGGSTLFFARRAENVISFESEPDWFARVSGAIKERNVENVDLRFGYESLNSLVRNNQKFNCVLIDPNKLINRDLLLDSVVGLIDKPGVLILDNYANSMLFPQTYSLTEQEFINKYLNHKWTAQTYEHDMWSGRGTRIFHRGLV